MARRKGPTFAEAHDGLVDGTTETRELIALGGRSRVGRSTVTIVCPFCRAHVDTYVWSLAGSGKRCECGALFGNAGVGYHWATSKPSVSKDDARRIADGRAMGFIQPDDPASSDPAPEHNTWSWGCTVPTSERANGDALDAGAVCPVCEPTDSEAH